MTLHWYGMLLAWYMLQYNILRRNIIADEEHATIKLSLCLATVVLPAWKWHILPKASVRPFCILPIRFAPISRLQQK